LEAIGMPRERLDEAASLIVDAVPGNPKPVDIPAIRALLADAFEGRRPSLDRMVGRTTHG
jgi:maleylacetate reductase